jgi:hypothetical protein
MYGHDTKSRIILVWDLEAISVWGTCIAIMISCEHVLRFVVQNKVSWTSDSTQIPLVGQFASRPHVYTIMCEFYVASPLCVNTCPYWMYYVIHKLQSFSRAMIHLGTNEHPIIKGMCKEFLEEIKVLI